MVRVHWFNPENDLALSSDSATYTPKKAAVRLRAAGAVLPLWYGDEGDQVLCYGVNASWYDRIRNEFDIRPVIFDHNVSEIMLPDPWGWSKYSKRYFRTQGFADDVLPSDETLVRWRNLSHRRTAMEVSHIVCQSLPDLKLAVPAVELSAVCDVEAWLCEHPKAFIKFPWSSSGRGVFDTVSNSHESVLKMASDSINRQGSVMLEVGYDRVVDFARLYRCQGGHCFDLGTSVFTTDGHNAYTGNVLASESYLLGLLGRYWPIDDLLRVFSSLREVLERHIAPAYEGILGVDMFISTDGVLDAVVEINLRKTMGYVARVFADRYMDADAVGRLDILPSSSEGADRGYKVRDGHLIEGTLCLTPDSTYFTIAASIDCPMR